MEDEKQDLNNFFKEVKEKLTDIEAIVRKYGYEEDFIMAVVAGIYRGETEGGRRLAAACDFVVENEEELDELMACGMSVYQHEMREAQAEAEGLPEELKDTSEWTSEDWINFFGGKTGEA